MQSYVPNPEDPEFDTPRPLRDAILEGFRKAGWTKPAENVVIEIETSVNNMEARAANEALKDERRTVAVKELLALGATGNPFLVTESQINLIIQRAQG